MTYSEPDLYKSIVNFEDAYDPLPPGTVTSDLVELSGRFKLRRNQGKMAFGQLEDGSGDIQLLATADETAEFDAFGEFPLGDEISVWGQVMTTRTGELGVKVLGWEALTTRADILANIDSYKVTHDVPLPEKLRRNSLTRDNVIGILIATGLTTLSYIVGLQANWISKVDWLEVFAVFTSYWCTWLCVKERRFNYPLGAISSAAYALLFYRLDLNASAVLNLYLVPTLIYGWIRWRKDVDTRPVTNVSLKMIPAYLAVAGLGYIGASLLSKQFDGAMAWTDSVILAGTILAQFLLDNKKLQNWIVWAVVNVFAIYTYAKSGLSLVAFQYVFFLANTFYGYYTWSKDRNHVDLADLTYTVEARA